MQLAMRRRLERLERLERRAQHGAPATPATVKLPEIPAEWGAWATWIIDRFRSGYLSFDTNRRITRGWAAGDDWAGYDALARVLCQVEDERGAILLPVLVSELDAAIAAIDAGSVDLQVGTGTGGQIIFSHLTIARPPDAGLLAALRPADTAVSMFTIRAGARWPVTLPEYRERLDLLRGLALDAGVEDAVI